MHFIDAQIQKWNFNYVRQSFIFCCYLRIAKFERESVHLGECISRDPECIFRGDRPDRFWTRVTENNELIIPMWITTASIQHTPCDVIVFYVHTYILKRVTLRWIDLHRKDKDGERSEREHCTIDRVNRTVNP